MTRGREAETPEKSDRQIAAVLGVDHKTVGAQRASLVGTGEIPQLATNTAQTEKSVRAKSTTSPFPYQRGIFLLGRSSFGTTRLRLPGTSKGFLGLAMPAGGCYF